MQRRAVRRRRRLIISDALGGSARRAINGDDGPRCTGGRKRPGGGMRLTLPLNPRPFYFSYFVWNWNYPHLSLRPKTNSNNNNNKKTGFRISYKNVSHNDLNTHTRFDFARFGSIQYYGSVKFFFLYIYIVSKLAARRVVTRNPEIRSKTRMSIKRKRRW